MGRTVTAPPPIQTTGLSDLYSIQEDGHDGAGADVPRSTSSYGYPVYPGNRVPGTPPPAALNSPRKLSGGSPTSTASTMFSRESVRSEMQRSSSWSSQTSFETFNSGQWKPVDYGYRTPEPLRRQRSHPQPDEQFSELPSEVLSLVLDMLKRSHLGGAAGTSSCATCWMRDLCNISLASRRCHKVARVALYEDIQLVGPDSAAHKKKYKLVHGARMLMLRRTLRSDNRIARLVKALKVPLPDTNAKGNNAKVLEQYEDLTASLVMACPNLERLSGPTPGYDHSFRKIYHALSTRPQLKQMDWIIEPPALPASKQKQKDKGTQSLPRQNSGGLLTPSSSGDLEAKLENEGAFLDLHRNWGMLDTLSIQSLGLSGCSDATLTPDSLLTRTLSMLPSLQHLHLCNLPPSAFNDSTLLELPPLQTLSLTHITGITSNGLSAFATRPGSQPLRRLHLRHTPLTSLAALARILSNLTSLTSFSLAQAFPPLMPEADSFTLWMMPYLASPSLAKLHWDITSHRDTANVADDILARSIAAQGFPQLRLLRCPNDPDAVFQDLCRPVERIDLPTDRFCPSDMPQPPSPSTPATAIEPTPPSPGLFLSRTSSAKTPTTPNTPSGDLSVPPPPCTDLRLARLAAQTRLEKARANPRFNVTVTECSESPTIVERFGLGGFIGTVGSPITYHLLPDIGSTDDRGGAVDVRDLSADRGESLASGREGCTGAWNRREGVVSDKKEKERWWHTERGRWTRFDLQ